MYDHLRTFFDSSISKGDTMADIKKRPKLLAFYEKHVKSRHYFFSVKKCGEDDCSVCFPKRIQQPLHHLPDPVPDQTGEHYLPFNVSCQQSLPHNVFVYVIITNSVVSSFDLLYCLYYFVIIYNIYIT